MAKRQKRRKRKADVICEERGSTGIYQNRTYKATTPDGEAWIGAETNRPLLSQLPEIEAGLRVWLDDVMGKDGWRYRVTSPWRNIGAERIRIGGKIVWSRCDTETEFVGEVVEWHIEESRLNALSPQMHEAAREVIEALGIIRIVNRAISMGEAGIAATWAYKMGQTIERIGVRHFERDAQAGIRSREGREKLTQSQAAEVEDNRAKFLAAYRGHRKDKVSHSGAIERAAQEVGISSPTAWRYAKALKLGKKKPAK